MKTLALVAFVSGLLTAGAAAQTAEEQQACMDDAFRLCSAFIPDRARVTACMVQNKSRLGAPCREVMARYDNAAKSAYSARRSAGTTGSRAKDE